MPMRGNWEERSRAFRSRWLLKRRNDWLREDRSKTVWQGQRPMGGTEQQCTIGETPHLPGMTGPTAALSTGWANLWEGQPWRDSGDGLQSHCSPHLELWVILPHGLMLPQATSWITEIYFSSHVGKLLIHGSHEPLFSTRNSEEIVLMQLVSRPQVVLKLSFPHYPFRIPSISSNCIFTLLVAVLLVGHKPSFLEGLYPWKAYPAQVEGLLFISTHSYSGTRGTRKWKPESPGAHTYYSPFLLYENSTMSFCFKVNCHCQCDDFSSKWWSLSTRDPKFQGSSRNMCFNRPSYLSLCHNSPFCLPGP